MSSLEWKCVSLQTTTPVTCPDRKHEIYLEMPLKNSTIVWKIGGRKIKSEFLFQNEKKKKQRELSWSQGPSQDEHKEMSMWIILVWLSCLAVTVGPSSTSALPTYKYCKSLLSICLCSQLPSAFWEAEGPNEPVTVLLRAKYALYSPVCLSTACDVCQLCSCETQITPMIQLKSSP